MASHTATLSVSGAKLIKALDDNGRRVQRRKRGPVGLIIKTSTIQLFEVQPNVPQGQCWMCFNGMWYQLC